MPDSRTWLRYFRLSRNARLEVEDEVAFHLAMRRRELEARGWNPGAAHTEAERIFGDVAAVTTQCLTIDQRRRRSHARREGVSDMLHDIRVAARSLRRSPAFSLAAITCIGLGVAVTTTIFSAVDGLLLRPLPYRDADRLVALYSATSRYGRGVNISYPDYLSWRDQNRTLETLGIWTWTTHTLSGEGGAERVDGAGVSPEVLRALGVRPLMGRLFTADEHPKSNARAILLGHDLWQRRYGGERSIVGRVITVDALPYTVIGVMPPGFSFPERGQVWVPFTLDDWGEGRGNRGYAGAVGKLGRGVTLEQAREDLDVIARRLEVEYRADNFGWRVDLLTLREDLIGGLRRALYVFLGAVGLVLLIGCANVANLMLARGTTRQRELALRVALGAGRWRVIRQVLTESMLLALAGGVLGAALARYGVELMRLAFPDDRPFSLALTLDPTGLLFALVVSVIAGLAAGLVPALRATGFDPALSLREGGRGDVGGGRGARARSALVVSEISLALVLLIGATLLVRSYRALLDTDLGFETDGVLTARVSLPEATYDTPEKRRLFWEQLFDRLRAIPGVEAVGSANGIPFSGWDVQAQFSIEGRPAPPAGEELVVHYQSVSPDYFAAIGVPLVRGRMLGPEDRDSAVRIGVINTVLARRGFGSADPIGKRLKVGGVDSGEAWITIVGVVREFRHYRLPQPMDPAIYFPLLASPRHTQTLAIRTTHVDPAAVTDELREILRSLDADVPAYQVRALDDVVSRSLWQQRLQGQVLATFASLALLLAAVGIYGVISYAVAQRTREVGVRVALGATRHHIISLVLGHSTRLAALGVLLGLAVALAATRFVASLLHGVSATDVGTFVGAPIVLVLVAILASVVPAAKALRVDPAQAMRVE